MTHERGNAHFNQPWNTLRNELSDDRTGEYYTGNYVLWYLLSRGTYILRLDMWTPDDVYVTAEFSGVGLGLEVKQFTLHLGAYDSGTASAGGLVTYHSGNAFSTHDNDETVNNCTRHNPAGWWYLRNTTVSRLQNDGSVSETNAECFTSLLTSQTGMTWALEDKDGVIRDHIDIDKVVMRLYVDPEAASRKYLLCNFVYFCCFSAVTVTAMTVK